MMEAEEAISRSRSADVFAIIALIPAGSERSLLTIVKVTQSNHTQKEPARPLLIHSSRNGLIASRVM